jgi:hypothetical protein
MDVLRLFAPTEEATPVPDRATLRRFRRIVSDLGNDLYVALVGERLLGFVQITYRRHIKFGLRGRVESLRVNADERAREVAASLVALAEQRARRRACFDLTYASKSASDYVDEALTGSGWVPADRELRLHLAEAESKPGSGN